MSRSIRSYLPEPHVRTEFDVVVAGRVSVALKEKIKLICKKNGWGSSEVIRAALEKFADDELPREGHFELPRTIDMSNTSAWK
jgi:hypothetical protein